MAARLSHRAQEIRARLIKDRPATFRETAHLMMELWGELSATEQKRRRDLDNGGNWFPEFTWMNGSLRRTLHRMWNEEAKGRNITPYWEACDAGLAHHHCCDVIAEVLDTLQDCPSDDFDSLSLDGLTRAKQAQDDRRQARKAHRNSPAAPSPTSTVAPSTPPAAATAVLPESLAAGGLGAEIQRKAAELRMSPLDWYHQAVSIHQTILTTRAAASTVEVPSAVLPEPAAAKEPPSGEPPPRPITRKRAKGKTKKAGKAPAPDKLDVRIHQLIGTREVTNLDVAKLLEEHGRLHPPSGDEKPWLPKSNDIATYLSLVLASCPDRFERVRRGVYKAREPYVPAEAVVNGASRFVN